jgi:hypothetical protein
MINLCFPLWRAFLLFFYVESSSSIFKHLLESIAVIPSVMCLSQNTVNCGITLMLVSLIFLLLVFSWTSEVPWHLCFALQIKASEIPPYHILLWELQSCNFLCFILLIIGVLVLLHSLHDYEVTLVVLLIMNCLSTWSYSEHIYIIWSKCVRESFFYRTQLLTELLEDKQ